MKNDSIYLFLAVFLCTLLCSLILCASVFCVVDFLPISRGLDKNENMTLKAIIEREGVEGELLLIENMIKIEKSKLDNYIEKRFLKNTAPTSGIYSEEIQMMFLDIKILPLKFQQDLKTQIINILQTRSGLRLKEELEALGSVVKMLASHFQLYEMGKKIHELEAVSKVENDPLEEKITKLLENLNEHEIKLRKVIGRKSLEPCDAKSTGILNCKENTELQEIYEEIVNYLKQANDSFKVIKESDLHFEKRPLLIKLYNHLKNIYDSTSHYFDVRNISE